MNEFLEKILQAQKLLQEAVPEPNQDIWVYIWVYDPVTGERIQITDQVNGP